ncbi:histidine kinase [Paenibacillus sp. LHD-38]|uniref:sensor histidine kinase n=1 Tax=Paenibacillus sp. LHD-38 TaxID=3072143 RepID=UPI00280D6D71|nr:histidine kinase [Paenibacillus sp. LHD-38]MDQ8733932.1 histidine kinase [Paenibacillus sp. LHD-38]
MFKIRRGTAGKMNIFTKVMIVIVLMLIPIIVMYDSSNKTSTEVVEQELLQINLNRIRFFVEQMDVEANRLWRAAFVVATDPDALQLQLRPSSEPDYSLLASKRLLLQKLDMQSTSFEWVNDFTVYSPQSDVVVSTNLKQNYDADYFRNASQERWDYRVIVTDRGPEKAFVRDLITPFEQLSKQRDPNLYVEVTFTSNNLMKMLERFMQGSVGQPFLYHPDFEPIMPRDLDPELIGAMTEQFDIIKAQNPTEGAVKITFRNEPYLVNYVTSTSLGWYLVDFQPMKKVLAPINHSKRMFYAAGLLLLLMGIASAGLLYRNVQKPINDLIRAVRSLRRGAYDHRIKRGPHNEFHYLIEQFNLMSEDIQTLIDKVYTEQLHAKESSLKHLQAQINPHFLYNNFAFIQSMAQLERTKVIVAFTQHLSQYYRYTTRTEQQLTSLAEEMELIRNYLEIHRMQSERLHFHEHIEEGMMSILMPRLLFQPLVENAIVHGMEGKAGKFEVVITGSMSEDGWELIIEDNGVGMHQDDIESLRNSLSLQASGDNSLGLRNVHQRLRHYYGQSSGLLIEHSSLGGLRVGLMIKDGGDSDVGSSDRR